MLRENEECSEMRDSEEVVELNSSYGGYKEERAGGCANGFCGLLMAMNPQKQQYIWLCDFSSWGLKV